MQLQCGERFVRPLHVSALLCAAAEPSWIAGVPSCASKELLNDNMRSKWGFNGYITSDCGAVGNVANSEPSGHGFTHDDSNLTAKTTLEAGMDNDCGELASGLHSSQDASDIVVDRPVLRRGQWHSSRSPELGLRPEGELDAAAQEPLPRANGFAKRRRFLDFVMSGSLN